MSGERFSIIIPAYNEEEAIDDILRRCLDAQTIGAEYLQAHLARTPRAELPTGVILQARRRVSAARGVAAGNGSGAGTGKSAVSGNDRGTAAGTPTVALNPPLSVSEPNPAPAESA